MLEKTLLRLQIMLVIAIYGWTLNAQSSNSERILSLDSASQLKHHLTDTAFLLSFANLYDSVSNVRDLKNMEYIKGLMVVIDDTISSDNHRIWSLKKFVLSNFENISGNYQQGFEIASAAYSEALDKKLEYKFILPLYRPLVYACYFTGNYKIGIGTSRACKIIAENTKDTFALVQVLNNLGTLYKELSRYDSAIYYLNTAKSLNPDNNIRLTKELSNTYNHLGVCYKNTYQLTKAIEYHKHALELRQRLYGVNSIWAAFSLNNIGVVYMSGMDSELAISYFKKVLNVFEQILPKDHPHFAVVYQNMGATFENILKYKEGEEYLIKALEIKKKYFPVRHPEFANIYAGLAAVYAEEDQFEVALDYAMKCYDISLESFGEISPEVSHSLGLISQVYVRNNRLLKAEEYAKKRVKVLKQTVGLYNIKTYDALSRLFFIKAKKGDWDEVDKIIDTLQFIIPSDSTTSLISEDVDSWLETSLGISSFYLDRYFGTNDSKFAVKSAVFSKQVLQSSLFNKEVETKMYDPGYLNGLVENQMRLAHITDLTSAQELFNMCESLKASQLSQKVSFERKTLKQIIPDEVVKREDEIVNKISTLKKSLFESSQGNMQEERRLFALDAELHDVNQLYSKFLDSLKLYYPKYFDLRFGRDRISLSECQSNLLNKDQALLEYFVGDSSIFTFTILPDTFYLHQIKKDFPLDSWVEDMLHGIYAPYMPRSDTLDRKFSYQQAASLIYQNVFHHVDTLLPPETNIIVVPDGILGYIPFDALLTDSTDSESFLIKDHQISYAYSATLQAEMENMRHNVEAEERILAFAPSFDQKDITGDTNMLASRYIDVSNSRNWLGPLKYNDDEVASISEVWPADVYLDSSATKSNFLREASDYRIIHLSTHGKANDKMGDYSFLAFYDPEDSSETWLYNRELYGLDLNADMVVLSACETGIGELQRGEGIISLARGFSYAGAKSIITTLWSVNDRSTQKLMELFYMHLAEGKRKDEALRAAKLIYLEQYPHLGKSPYFWAGIIPIGDMSPIVLASFWSHSIWIWLTGLLLSVLVFWTFRKFF